MQAFDHQSRQNTITGRCGGSGRTDRQTDRQTERQAGRRCAHRRLSGTCRPYLDGGGEVPTRVQEHAGAWTALCAAGVVSGWFSLASSSLGVGSRADGGLSVGTRPAAGTGRRHWLRWLSLTCSSLFSPLFALSALVLFFAHAAGPCAGAVGCATTSFRAASRFRAKAARPAPIAV